MRAARGPARSNLMKGGGGGAKMSWRKGFYQSTIDLETVCLSNTFVVFFQSTNDIFMAGKRTFQPPGPPPPTRAPPLAPCSQPRAVPASSPATRTGALTAGPALVSAARPAHRCCLPAVPRVVGALVLTLALVAPTPVCKKRSRPVRVPRRCFALLGHNGAGKTTTINMVTAQLRPDEVPN